MADPIHTPQHIVHLGPVEHVPLGQGHCYIVGSDEIAVFRQRDGRLFATQHRCPHRQGPLADGLLGGGRVICPLHGHTFNLESGEGTEPGERLRVYVVEDRGGELLLHLSAAEPPPAPPQP